MPETKPLTAAEVDQIDARLRRDGWVVLTGGTAPTCWCQIRHPDGRISHHEGETRGAVIAAAYAWAAENEKLDQDELRRLAGELADALKTIRYPRVVGLPETPIDPSLYRCVACLRKRKDGCKPDCPIQAVLASAAKLGIGGENG